ncbi:MAG: hypothetical protein EZS28_010317 [Streblomastix strix]|uniref:Uncharacterized protein n=1 Tax=Streblomastix strix TaxID=222440 RepID=A0A5J4WGQ7_9EUKA|nr:MAG: hypothetical protein EZS28_010317 [Streblomastix strix]
MRFASTQPECDWQLSSLAHHATANDTMVTAIGQAQQSSYGRETSSFSSGTFSTNPQFDQRSFQRNIQEQFISFQQSVKDGENNQFTEESDPISVSCRSASPTFPLTSLSYNIHPSSNIFQQTFNEPKNKSNVETEIASRFLEPTQRLVGLLFFYFNPKLFNECISGDGINERVIQQSQCVLKNAARVRPELLNEHHKAGEVTAASMYIALQTTGIGVKNMMNTLCNNELSDLCSFQEYVNAIEEVD